MVPWSVEPSLVVMVSALADNVARVATMSAQVSLWIIGRAVCLKPAVVIAVLIDIKTFSSVFRRYVIWLRRLVEWFVFFCERARFRLAQIKNVHLHEELSVLSKYLNSYLFGFADHNRLCA